MSKLEQLVKLVSKEELYKYYIIDNHHYNDTFEHFNISRKDLRRLLTEYSIVKDYKLRAKNNHYKRSHEQSVAVGKKSSETQKKSWSNKEDSEKIAWSIKCKEAQLNMSEDAKLKKVSKAKETYYSKSKKEIDDINLRRSMSCKKAWEDKSLIERQHETRRKNRNSGICRSKLEQSIYDFLIKVFPDLVYDKIIDNRYNYYVDFYIPSKDLFIEINGHPSHGNYPYIDGDKISMNESYKLYGDWLKVYTELDVHKYEMATMNNLNYLRIYPYNTLETNYKINNYNEKEVIKLIFDSITK